MRANTRAITACKEKWDSFLLGSFFDTNDGRNTVHQMSVFKLYGIMVQMSQDSLDADNKMLAIAKVVYKK
jgi:hypothetical protein